MVAVVKIECNFQLNKKIESKLDRLLSYNSVEVF